MNNRETGNVRWWIKWTIGPWPVRVAVFTAFTACAIAAWSLGEAVRVADQNHRFSHAAVRANIRARYDDCVSGNALRQGLTLVARQQQLPDNVIKRLFPNVPDSLIRKSRATFTLELRLFSPRNCRQYAEEALPKP